MESKSIVEFDNMYIIEKNGNVFSKYTNRYIKPKVNHKGYLYFGLRKDGKQKSIFQHRLIANYWIPNPENKPQVNHINCDKKDNRVENLEWCTQSENQLHSYRNGRVAAYKNKFSKDHNTSKAIAIKKDNIVHTFESLTDASNYLSVSIQAISMCLRGINKTCKGFKVTYCNS